jgi:cytochrome c oxidase assembly factor CtaG
MRARAAVAAAAWSAPAAAFAHGSPPFAPGWSFEPWAFAPMLLAAGLFGLGWRRLRRRSGPGRAALDRHAKLFWLGLGVLAGAVISPLHALGARSFSAHMLEHELIMLAAAPLLVWSRPLPVMLWALPPSARQALGALVRTRAVARSWRTVSDPAVATALQAAALWIWHLPGPFDLALGSEGWHAAQHLCFFGSALVFWSAMIGPRRSAWTAAACLFATSMISGALGALMAVSPSPWYAAYARLGLAAFGLTPTQDQQLAGVLMWVPGGLVHAAAALAILAPRLRAHSGGVNA